MERVKGKASSGWGRYDPNPPTSLVLKKRIKLVSDGSKTKRDPMCDYIEGAEWWTARSKHSVRKLQSLFDQEEVACVMIERVGAIYPLGKQGNQYLIAIQVIRFGGNKDWDIDLALEDACIYLEEPYEPDVDGH